MNVHLRQICLVAENIQSVTDLLTQIIELQPCYTDPSVAEFGLRNVLFPVGSNFLEIVSPIRENTAAGRYLSKLGGDGGYMIICQATKKISQEAIRTRAEKKGVRVAWHSTTGDFHCMQLHPADMGGAFFEVDWDAKSDACGNWHPAGGVTWKDDRYSGSKCKFLGARIQSSDPDGLAYHWSSISGLKVSKTDDELRLLFANAYLAFCKVKNNRGECLSEIDLEVKNTSVILERARVCNLETIGGAIEIGGVIFNLLKSNLSKNDGG